jgi:hypothetical protein
LDGGGSEPHELAAELHEWQGPVQLPLAHGLRRDPEEAGDVVDRPQGALDPVG